MIEFLKTKLIWLLAIVLALSVAGNVYFIMGKGIVINNTNNAISNSTSNSYANSGSMSVGYIGGDARGNWEIKKVEINNDSTIPSERSIHGFLKTLDPIQFMNCKVVYDAYPIKKVWVYYPEIVSVQKEDHKVKKIVNGVEVK